MKNNFFIVPANMIANGLWAMPTNQVEWFTQLGLKPSWAIRNKILLREDGGYAVVPKDGSELTAAFRRKAVPAECPATSWGTWSISRFMNMNLDIKGKYSRKAVLQVIENERAGLYPG